MVGLAFASLVTWTVWLAKGIELLAAKQYAAPRAPAAYRSRQPVRGSARDRKARAQGCAGADGAGRAVGSRALGPVVAGRHQRACRHRPVAHRSARRWRSMARGTGLLATIGATAPFVGLFGTVWGIMNSFIGICIPRPPISRSSRPASPKHCLRPHRARRRHSGGHHLQRVRACYCRLPGAVGCLRRNPSAHVTRPGAGARVPP